MAEQRDYYSILQVNRGAAQDAIERAYERLAKIYDPAVSRKPKAAIRFKEISEAYAVLSDKKSRADYDRLSRKPGSIAIPENPVSSFVSRNYMWVAAGGVVGAIAIALVLIVTLGGGGSGNVGANQPSGSPSAEGSPTVTPEGQTPAPGAPANPPAVTGEEKTTDTGLRYIDIQEGTGVTPKPGQTVVVNYTGWLESTGAKFDSSLDRGQPFSFVLGVGKVIDGWDQGLGTMKVGGQRRLIIPPGLGYGERGAGTTIPPNSTLIFDVELLDVKASASPGQ